MAALRPRGKHTYNRGSHAEAFVLRDVVHLVIRIDGVVVSQLQHLLEGVIDEDEAYETGEALLGEAGEVLHQEAGIGGHQHQAEERRPQADPQAELQIIKLIVPARRSKASTESTRIIASHSVEP